MENSSSTHLLCSHFGSPLRSLLAPSSLVEMEPTSSHSNWQFQPTKVSMLVRTQQNLDTTFSHQITIFMYKSEPPTLFWSSPSLGTIHFLGRGGGSEEFGRGVVSKKIYTVKRGVSLHIFSSLVMGVIKKKDI